MKLIEDIYFLKADVLAQKLRDGGVSEALALKHLIASLVLGGIGFQIPVTVSFKEEATSGIRLMLVTMGFILAGVITYYGVWLTFQANKAGDGRDYFLRFAALSLPVGIRVTLLFLVIGLFVALIAGIAASAVGTSILYLTEGVFVLLNMAFTAMFFVYIREYISIAAGRIE